MPEYVPKTGCRMGGPLYAHTVTPTNDLELATKGYVDTITGTIGDISTSDLPEGSNLYFTSARARTAMAVRVVSMTDATSFTPTGDSADINTQANTQVTGTLTANAPSGSPANGQILTVRIKSTNVQTFSWNSIYRGCVTVALPTASTGTSKTDYFTFRYNTADTKWDIVSALYGF